METTFTECVVCMDAPEHETCPVCNMTGSEIVFARQLVSVGVEQ